VQFIFEEIMKKILLLIIISTLFISCDKLGSDIIDYQAGNYEQTLIKKITADSIYSIKIKNDSVYKIKIDFLKVATNLSKVKVQLIYLSNQSVIQEFNANIKNNIIDTSIILHNNYKNGKYVIKVNGLNIDNKIIQEQSPLAQIFFKFINNNDNTVPECTELNLPDSLYAPDIFIISAKILDKDGLEDIKKVYFITYRPDGTTNGTQFEMFDDGNYYSNGDINAKDGIYSRILSLPVSTTKGNWKFEVYAVDYSDAVSKPVSKILLVK
jgi:hypothetical protein